MDQGFKLELTPIKQDFIMCNWYGISRQKVTKISVSTQVLCFHDCGLELELIVLWLLHGHLTSEWMYIEPIPTEDKSQMGVFLPSVKKVLLMKENTLHQGWGLLWHGAPGLQTADTAG